MSDEEKLKTANDLLTFMMVNFGDDSLFIAANSEELAKGFVEVYNNAIRSFLNGDEQQFNQYRIECWKDDSDAGGDEADNGEAGGELRPGPRKLH